VLESIEKQWGGIGGVAHSFLSEKEAGKKNGEGGSGGAFMAGGREKGRGWSLSHHMEREEEGVGGRGHGLTNGQHPAGTTRARRPRSCGGGSGACCRAAQRGNWGGGRCRQVGLGYNARV
jgi:hypothetical protein